MGSDTSFEMQQLSEDPQNAVDLCIMFVIFIQDVHSHRSKSSSNQLNHQSANQWKILHNWVEARVVRQYYRSTFEVICHARINPSKKLKLVEIIKHLIWLLKRSISNWRRYSIRYYKTQKTSIFLLIASKQFWVNQPAVYNNSFWCSVK